MLAGNSASTESVCVKMSKVQMLRALVKQRLTAAAEDIFGLFERTIAEYEETLCRSKEENERQRRLLDAVFNPQLRLHRADVQQLSVSKEEVPPEEQQEWRTSLDQEDPPEPQHIKEEQEELWTSQEGEQLQGLEEADITKFTFTPVPVKSEDDDEEKPQSSQLHQRQTEQMETEGDGEDCGGPEPDRNSHPDTHLEPVREGTHDDGDDFKESREPQSGLNSLKNIDIYEGCVVESIRQTEQMKTEADREDCRGPGPHPDTHLQPGSEDSDDDDDWKESLEPQSGLNFMKKKGCNSFGKRLSCSVCGKQFRESSNLKVHMRIHTGEKPFSCLVCGKGFIQKAHLRNHLKYHTGEKSYICTFCNMFFSQSDTLLSHMRTHPKEKPFSCDVCHRSFAWSHLVKRHKCGGESTRQTEQMKTEADGEDCRGPEPAMNSHPDSDLTPDANDKI